MRELSSGRMQKQYEHQPEGQSFIAPIIPQPFLKLSSTEDKIHHIRLRVIDNRSRLYILPSGFADPSPKLQVFEFKPARQVSIVSGMMFDAGLWENIWALNLS
jgi:hypothetical protein